MGRRGPAPEPTALRLLKGNPGKRPLNDREPEPRKDTPRCPEWLDQDAKDKWAELVPELQGMGVLTYIDGDALANYCQTWSRWKRAEEFIQKHGDVIPFKNEDGTLRHLQQVPQVAIARGLLQVINRYQREFGLTPSARTQLKVENTNELDEFDRFVRERAG